MIGNNRTTDNARSAPVFETAGWLLTSILIAIQFLSPDARVSSLIPELITVAVLMAAATILFRGVTRGKLESSARLSRHHASMAFCVVMVTAISFFLYFAPSTTGLSPYLYLIPLSVSILIAGPNAVAAIASLSLLSMLFLRASTSLTEPFLDSDYVLELSVFTVVSVCLALISRHLRQIIGRAESMSVELSVSLEKIRVISTLVRQAEHTSRIDQLIERAGKIIADATGFKRCVILVNDGSRLGPLGKPSASDSEGYGRACEEVDMAWIRGVMETGISRFFGQKHVDACHFSSSSDISGILVVPLRLHDSSIGALCLINGNWVDIDSERLGYCELLASFVATMLDTAIFCHKTKDELDVACRMTKLMIGRENRMRDMKLRAKETTEAL